MNLKRTLAVVAGTMALVLGGAAGAQAKVVELTGTTTFTPSQQATQFLANHGVSVTPTGEAIAEEGSFVFPIAAGFGYPRTFSGLLAHKGGLKFTKGERSAVVRRFVAVRHRGVAVLLAQVPGLRGGCGHLKAALRRFGATHPGAARHARKAARNHPKGARKLLRGVRNYCHGGRVIVLARLTNLGKTLDYGGALLTADLELSRAAARLLNRLAGERIVSAGAPLGTAVSRVSVVD
jgi:hypothetical protein